MEQRLVDRVCVVTGATGMAAAAATSIAREGGSVFVVSRRVDGAEALAEEVRSLGVDAGAAAADLRDEEATDRAFALAMERFGRIDGLFAVAGGSARAGL